MSTQKHTNKTGRTIFAWLPVFLTTTPFPSPPVDRRGHQTQRKRHAMHAQKARHVRARPSWLGGRAVGVSFVPGARGDLPACLSAATSQGGMAELCSVSFGSLVPLPSVWCRSLWLWVRVNCLERNDGTECCSRWDWLGIQDRARQLAYELVIFGRYKKEGKAHLFPQT